MIVQCERFCELVEGEELMHNDEGTNSVTDYEMPSFHLEEGVTGSAAKVCHSITLNHNLDFKILHGGNSLLILYFEGTF